MTSLQVHGRLFCTHSRPFGSSGFIYPGNGIGGFDPAASWTVTENQLETRGQNQPAKMDFFYGKQLKLSFPGQSVS